MSKNGIIRLFLETKKIPLVFESKHKYVWLETPLRFK